MSYLVFRTNPLVYQYYLLLQLGSHAHFLATSLLTTLLSFLKSAGTVFNLWTSILSISAFKFSKFDFSANLEVSIPVEFFQSAFVTERFKFSKFDFSADLEVSIPVEFFQSAFVAGLDKSTSILMSPPKV